MTRLLQWFCSACLLFSGLALSAQTGVSQANAQVDFALAAATAHARTSLFGADAKPFTISATVRSTLGLHGTGQGTYKNERVDAQHWRRTIKFPDFQQTEMRNDVGHSWVDQSNDTMPLRLRQMLRVVVVHLPSSTAASHIIVSESSAVGEDGASLTCYSYTSPKPATDFAPHARWCFDKVTGLLASEDMPLNTHIVYSKYITFQGKQEFTHVHMTAGSFPVLDIDLRYADLDPHALDSISPYSTMHRSASAETAPNPEEVQKGSVEYSELPILPAGTSDADKNKPVQLRFEVSADNKLVDAIVEDAPTQAMAEAALLAARSSVFTPFTVDGKPVRNSFYHSVWFRSGVNGPLSPESAAGPRSGAGTAVPKLPSTLNLSSYSSSEPSLVFRYPSDFEQIPRGMLEQDQRTRGGPHYGLTPGVGCNALLFRAQRLREGQRSPEVISMIDLAPLCIVGEIDEKGLETTAMQAARSIVAQMAEGSATKVKHYTVNERNFAVVSTVGIGHETIPLEVAAIVIVTRVRDHVVAWTITGPDKDALANTLRTCTLQIGKATEDPLLTLLGTP